MKSKLKLALFLAASLMLIPAASAAVTFTVSVNGGNACNNGSIPTTSTAPVAIAANWLCTTGTASGQAIAGPGSVGVEAKTDYYCCGTFSQASSVAEFATTFTISGAGGQPIPVSLNFNLEGLAFKREGGYWAIFVDAFPFGTGSVDSNGATSGFLGGALVNDGDLVASGLVVTPEVMLLPNTLINFLFRLTAVSISAGQTSLSHVEFADTASLPLTGPVFNLPDGYTVDIPDLFVANNRYLPPGGAGVGGEVPEPATFTTAAAGLAVLALVMRRRRD